MLADITGKPAIQRVFDRLARCSMLDGMVLATSTSPSDDPLAHWADAHGIACFRGSEEDVLGRVVEAHRSQATELIVEITGDCILTDPGVVDRGVATWHEMDVDVVTTTATPSYPIGIDVQVFPFDLLADIERTYDSPVVREHVSLPFYRTPERYRRHDLRAPPGSEDPELRLVLDYPEDLDFLRTIQATLEPLHGPCFGVEPILELLRERPELRRINEHRKETCIP